MRRTTGPVISYPLYFAGLATMLCALVALNSAVADSQFATITCLLLCAGYLTSILLRRIGCTTRLIEFAVIIAAALIYIQVISNGAISELIIPPNASGSPEMKLATMLLWLEIFRSFTMVSDESVVFSSIPAVVLISLTTTSNVNSEIMAAFILYLVLASFMLSHKPQSSNQSTKSGFKIAIAITCLSLVIGCIAVFPIKIACTKAFALAMPEFTRLRDQSGFANYSDPNMLQISQGPIKLSSEIVMTVTSRSIKSGDPVAAYWRGKVFDRYTGHGWRSSAQFILSASEQIDASDYSRGWRRYTSPTLAISDKRELIEQTIKPNLMIGRTIYAAAEPVTIDGPFAMLQYNEFNCWHTFSGIAQGEGYRVVSAMPVTDQNKLRSSSATYSKYIKTYFLQTTTSTAKVGHLSRSITAGITNPYDKAIAIQKYIGEKCTYDLNAPPAPPGEDAVDYFLFTSRLGYCDVFASAMVIMCRESGVPARLATGYATGDYDANAGVFNVRGMDRHAWAEIYFPDYGWVPFDPTESTIDRSESMWGRISTSFNRMIDNIMRGQVILPLVIISLIAGAALAFAPDLKKFQLSRKTTGPSKLHSAFVARYEAIRRSLKAQESLTPFEAAIAGTRSSPEASAIALEAAELFSDIRYGKREVTVEDVNELKRLHKELRSALSREQADRRDTTS